MGVEGKEPKTSIVNSTVDALFNWARTSSLWFLTYGIACCAIELMAASASRYDLERFGIIPRASPRQSDVMIVAGPVVKKMVPVIRTLYAQMADPKYVIAMGTCAVSGGLFRDSYNVVRGADKVVPVDIFVPGCHPRPEALLQGFIELQKKIVKERPSETAAANLRRWLRLEADSKKRMSDAG